MLTKTINAEESQDPVQSIIDALGWHVIQEEPEEPHPSPPYHTLRFERIVLNGVFDFGNRTIRIGHDVIIEAGPLGATIRGGGAYIYDSDTLFEDVQCGPFRVSVGTPKPPPPHVQRVAFRNLQFSGWRGPAIFVDACHGLEVSGCRFVDPLPGTSTGVQVTPEGGTQRPIKQSAAILAGGPRCTGGLLVQGNTCDFSPSLPGGLPDDEEFVGCIQTGFAAIDVLANDIATRDDGIEIMFNRPAQGGGRIRIDGNHIAIASSLGETWLVHAAIICCDNAVGTWHTEITNNDLRVTGSNTTLFLLTGDHFQVESNTGYHGPQPLASPPPPFLYSATFCLGLGLSTPPIPNLGPSFNDSTIRRNTISGEAQHGIWFFDPHDLPELGLQLDVNESHGNVVENNKFDGFKGQQDVVHLGPLTHDNRFVGSFGNGGVENAGTNNQGL